VPALVVLVDTGARSWRWLAVLVYVTTAFSVPMWFEWGLSEARFGHGLPGFLITNWYVLLMLALLVALPAASRRTAATRRTASPAGTAPSPGSAGR
jgi:alpha-1,2-mannosyltransferase